MNDSDDRDTVEIEITTEDDVDMRHVVDAEIIDEEAPELRLRWHPESWTVMEPARLPNYSATVMQVRPGQKGYAYIYRTAADPPEVIWRGKAFDSLELGQAGVESWLFEHAEWNPVEGDQE